MTSEKSEYLTLPTESMVNDVDETNRDSLTPSYFHYPNIAKLFSGGPISRVDDDPRAP